MIIPIQQPIQSNTQLSQTKLYELFISKFADLEFLKLIINVSLYHSDFKLSNTSSSSDVILFFRKYLDDINKELITSKIPINPIIPSLIKTIHKILQIKDDISARIITYDNISQHFPNDVYISKILSSIVPIEHVDEYRKQLEFIVQTIQIFNEFKNVRETIFKIDNFIETINTGDEQNVYSLVSNYRNIILDSYNALSSLKTITKNEQLSDYLILSNEDGSDHVISRLMNFFSSGYTFLKSGYELIDKCIGGVEASSVHIISGPSNHCKSIFMINMMKNMVDLFSENNEKNDVIVFITLEDDIYKLMRRFFSIFGNYDTRLIKQLFIETSEIAKSQNYKDIVLSENFRVINNIFTKVYNESLKCISSNKLKNEQTDKIKIILKHSTENSFTPNDVIKFIDTLQLNNYRVRALFIDYIDVMLPSDRIYSKHDDYNSQGQIVQELRVISRNYKMPVVTITQNSRSSEDFSQSLNNTMLGDSIKKLRYSDYLYMLRQRKDIDIYQDVIKKDIKIEEISNNQNENVSMFSDKMQEELQYLIPLEIKITKAKEGEKDISKFHLFSKRNLRIYDTMEQVKQDMTELIYKSTELQKDINTMSLLSNIDQINFGLTEIEPELFI